MSSSLSPISPNLKLLLAGLTSVLAKAFLLHSSWWIPSLPRNCWFSETLPRSWSWILLLIPVMQTVVDLKIPSTLPQVSPLINRTEETSPGHQDLGQHPWSHEVTLDMLHVASGTSRAPVEGQQGVTTPELPGLAASPLHPSSKSPASMKLQKQNYLPKEKRYTVGDRGGFNNKLKHHHTQDGSSSCPNVDKKMLPLKSDWNQTRKPTNCEDCDLSPWQNWKDSRKNKQNNDNNKKPHRIVQSSEKKETNWKTWRRKFWTHST